MPSRPAFRGKRPESPPLRPRARADWATQKTLVSFSPDNVHETGVSMDSPDPPSRPLRRSRSANSRKDPVTAPIRGFCAIQGVRVGV
jgi:hypothetical protein